jgi:hypothetical protein
MWCICSAGSCSREGLTVSGRDPSTWCLHFCVVIWVVAEVVFTVTGAAAVSRTRTCQPFVSTRVYPNLEPVLRAGALSIAGGVSGPPCTVYQAV